MPYNLYTIHTYWDCRIQLRGWDVAAIDTFCHGVVGTCTVTKAGKPPRFKLPKVNMMKNIYHHERLLWAKNTMVTILSTISAKYFCKLMYRGPLYAQRHACMHALKLSTNKSGNMKSHCISLQLSHSIPTNFPIDSSDNIWNVSNIFTLISCFTMQPSLVTLIERLVQCLCQWMPNEDTWNLHFVWIYLDGLVILTMPACGLFCDDGFGWRILEYI